MPSDTVVPSSLTIWLAPPSAGRSTRHRGACLHFDGVRHGVPDYVFYDYCGEHCSLFSLDQPLAGFLVQSMTTSSRDKLLRVMLSCFSVGQPLAGFLVKSMRLIPTNMVGHTCERGFDCSGSHVKRAPTTSATVHEVRVLSFPNERT